MLALLASACITILIILFMCVSIHDIRITAIVLVRFLLLVFLVRLLLVLLGFLSFAIAVRAGCRSRKQVLSLVHGEFVLRLHTLVGKSWTNVGTAVCSLLQHLLWQSVVLHVVRAERFAAQHGTTKVIHGQDAAPAVLVFDECKSLRLSCVFFADQVNIFDLTKLRKYAEDIPFCQFIHQVADVDPWCFLKLGMPRSWGPRKSQLQLALVDVGDFSYSVHGCGVYSEKRRP
mmetsp:Transcript_15734/g.43458  ORF Transcript_15734/g.43458 Transcript_15734/m.43458 type:complete len:231 (+) Transcript_15734:33-725(+)